MNIALKISAQAAAALAELRTMPSRLMGAVARGLDAALEVGMTQALKTNFTGKGPFPVSEHRLGVRSGRLRGSFQRQPAKQDGGRLTASIGSNVKYWLAHEFGFEGAVTVKGHARAAARNAKGKRITLAAARKSRAKVAPTISSYQVRSHTRKVSIPERMPMRAGIQAQTDAMGTIISTEILKEWRKR